MSRYSEHNIAPHPPLAHKYYHKDERVPCGCATDVRQAPTVVCKYCGAVYDWNAVVSFLSFRCYDCGRYEYDWHKRVADPPVEWVGKEIPINQVIMTAEYMQDSIDRSFKKIEVKE